MSGLSHVFVFLCVFFHCSMSLRSSLRRQGVAGEKTVRYQDPEGDNKKGKHVGIQFEL